MSITKAIEVREPHIPTQEKREMVMAFVSFGLDENEIAFVLKCSPLDVRQHYSEELENGKAMVTAKVGAVMLKMAMMGDKDAARFILQTRSRWGTPAPQKDVKPADTQQQDATKKQLVEGILKSASAALSRQREPVPSVPDRR